MQRECDDNQHPIGNSSCHSIHLQRNNQKLQAERMKHNRVPKQPWEAQRNNDKKPKYGPVQ